jgi:hypothetical protein
LHVWISALNLELSTRVDDGNAWAQWLKGMFDECLSYHGVTLEAGMFLTTYYLSLLEVHQVHAKQRKGPFWVVYKEAIKFGVNYARNTSCTQIGRAFQSK